MRRVRARVVSSVHAGGHRPSADNTGYKQVLTVLYVHEEQLVIWNPARNLVAFRHKPALLKRTRRDVALTEGIFAPVLSELAEFSRHAQRFA